MWCKNKLFHAFKGIKKQPFLAKFFPPWGCFRGAENPKFRGDSPGIDDRRASTTVRIIPEKKRGKSPQGLLTTWANNPEIPKYNTQITQCLFAGFFH
jgi:hypothetical protein